MPIKEYPHTWNVDALFDEIRCPCCGGDVWIEQRGNGFWCDNCNAQVTKIREPVGDQGYVVEFDDSCVWTSHSKKTFPENAVVSAKYLGVNNPELYWFSVRDADTGDNMEWNPVERSGDTAEAS